MINDDVIKGEVYGKEYRIMNTRHTFKAFTWRQILDETEVYHKKFSSRHLRQTFFMQSKWFTTKGNIY